MRRILVTLLVLGSVAWLAPAHAAAGVKLSATLTGNGTGAVRYEERPTATATAWRLEVRVQGVTLPDPDPQKCQCGLDPVVDVVIGQQQVGSFKLQKSASIGQLRLENLNGTSIAKAGDAVTLVLHASGATLQQGTLA